MQIFFVIDTLNVGGAEKSTIDIISRLSGDVRAVLVVPYTGNTSLEIKELPSSIEIIRFGLSGKYEFGKAIRLFTELCKERKPDLVVATLFRSEIISRIVCKRLKIKNIGTFVNDTYSPYEMERLGSLQKAKIIFFKIINSYTSKYCYRLLANSDSIKLSNSKALNVPLSKIDVIYRGRDISRFETKKETVINNKQIRFLNVGRLLHRKGQAEMIRAFALFSEETPGATLAIAGEGAYRDELMKLIRELGLENKVSLLGNVNDIGSLYAQYDVFVFPSHYEGFSGALVEAMLSGIPILASDIAMNKDAIDHLTEGYLFQVKNTQAILVAMRFARDNAAAMKEMAINAREYAIVNFDINNIAVQHEQYYKECLQKI